MNFKRLLSLTRLRIAVFRARKRPAGLGVYRVVSWSRHAVNDYETSVVPMVVRRTGSVRKTLSGLLRGLRRTFPGFRRHATGARARRAGLWGYFAAHTRAATGGRTVWETLAAC